MFDTDTYMYKYGFRFSIYIWYFLKGMVAGFFYCKSAPK